MRKAADSVPEEMLESAREENPDRARLLDETSRIRGRIDAVAEQIQDRALAHMETHRRHVVSLSNRAERNLLTTIVLTGMVGIYLVLFLPSRVVRSLRRITHVLQQAQRGDLDVSTLETGSDEVGSLAGHLNRLLRQVRTFDDLKTERMLRAERRLGILVENLEEGIILVDDEMKPAFVSRRARQLLDARPEGADDARIAGILAEDDFAAILRQTIESQSAAGAAHRLPGRGNFRAPAPAGLGRPRPRQERGGEGNPPPHPQGRVAALLRVWRVCGAAPSPSPGKRRRPPARRGRHPAPGATCPPGSGSPRR